MLHKFQIEVTTRCNYSCWYCAGRHMKQKDMSWDIFVSICDKIPKGSTVNLQGEGEPFLWQYFWDAVKYLRQLDIVPFVITNGTIIDVELINKYFPKIAITIDSLIEQESIKNGRFNIEKVKTNVEKLASVMQDRITIYTVDTGIDIGQLKLWVESINVNHLIKSLEQKSDYIKFYPSNYKQSNFKSSMLPYCSYLTSNEYKFWNVDGIELPCCYIKENAQDFKRHEALKSFSSGIIPSSCFGCSKIK